MTAGTSKFLAVRAKVCSLFLEVPLRRRHAPPRNEEDGREAASRVARSVDGVCARRRLWYGAGWVGWL